MFFYNLKKINLISTLVISLLFLGFLITFFLTSTASGLALAMNTSLSDPSARISISTVSRKFGGPTTITGLNYHSDSLDIFFDTIAMDWDFSSVFGSQVIIKQLAGEQLTVDVKRNQSGENPVENLRFPFAANVIKADIHNLKVLSAGNEIYSVTDVSIDNIFMAESFQADKVVLNTVDGQWIQLSGQFGFSDSSVINLTTESSTAIPFTGENMRAKGTIVGNVERLRFLQHVKYPISAEVTGRITHIFTNPGWIVNSEIRSTNLSSVSAKNYLKNINGTVSLTGTPSEFHLNSDLTVKDINDDNWTSQLEAASSTNGIKFNVSLKNKKSGTPSSASLTGTVNLIDLFTIPVNIRSLRFNGEWKNITLTLNDSNMVKAKSGEMSFDGKTLLTHINAKGVKINNLGPTLSDVAMNTQKDASGGLLFNGSANSTEGNLKLSGSMIKRNQEYQLDNLFLTGNNFTLVRKPQAHIIISPNLSFVRKDEVMTSTGTVKIPMANIQLQEFRKTLSSLSSLINSKNGTVSSTGHVDLEFGKSVWMHGFGLNANVTGELLLSDLSNKQILANGVLNVLQGNYRNLSANHALSGGQLIFDNQDIDNPDLALNIKSKQYSPEESRKITGRLQKLFTNSNQKSSHEKAVETISNRNDAKKNRVLMSSR